MAQIHTKLQLKCILLKEIFLSKVYVNFYW